MRLYRLLVSAAAVGVAALASPALAQPESPRSPPETQAPPSTSSPSTPAPDGASDRSGDASTDRSGDSSAPASFTDDQLKSFLKAHDDIGHLKSMGTTPSNEQMAEAISRNGLDVTTYNAIGHALRGDQELQRRVASLRTAAPTPG